MRTPAAVREFFRSHWTARKYKAVPMPAEDLDVILEAAQRAPTDATAQMYSFVRLTDPALRAEIAQRAGNPHIATASESFLICADIHRLERTLSEGGYEPGYFPHIAIHFALGDAVLAGQNMLVAAEMLGYRGCWIGGVVNAPEEIAAAVKLPSGVFAFAALTIGVPDEAPQFRPRLPRTLVVHENFYRDPPKDELAAGVRDMAAITQRGDWAQTLARYFGKGGGMEAREIKLGAFLRRTIFKGKMSGC